MLFYSGYGEQPQAPIVHSAPIAGQGGGEWVHNQEPPTTAGFWEKFLQPRDLGGAGITPNATSYKTGPGLASGIPRINWGKVADFRLPVEDGTVSSGFGWREPPCKECSSYHLGVDFVPGEGTPVFASLDGTVVNLGYNGSFGFFVIIEHVIPSGSGRDFDRWETAYAHLQEGSIPELLRVGSVVRGGEIIGRVGNTGVSTGPHLHFEIRLNGEPLDPIPLLGNYQIIKVDLDTGDHEIFYE